MSKIKSAMMGKSERLSAQQMARFTAPAALQKQWLLFLAKEYGVQPFVAPNKPF